jgi:hypothetical protein
MNNIINKMIKIKDNDLNIKFKFLSDVILSNLPELINKTAYIESIKIPIELITNDDFNSILNGIFGYYVYLNESNIINANDIFIRDSLHDLRIYLKHSSEKLITKKYFTYLK